MIFLLFFHYLIKSPLSEQLPDTLCFNHLIQYSLYSLIKYYMNRVSPCTSYNEFRKKNNELNQTSESNLSEITKLAM